MKAIVFVFVFSSFFSQMAFSRSFIQGKIYSYTSKIPLYYYAPYPDGTANYMYNAQPIAVNQKGVFVLKAKAAGIYNLHIKNNTFNIFLGPSDSVYLQIYLPKNAEEKGIDSIQIAGSNYKALNVYNRYRAEITQENIFKTLLLQPYSNVEAFIKPIRERIASMTFQVGSGSKEDEAGPTCSTIINTDLRAVYLKNILTILTVLNRKNSNPPKPTQNLKTIEGLISKAFNTNPLLFSDKSFDSIRLAVYAIQNPLDANLKYSSYGIMLANHYAKDVLHGLIPVKDSYDSTFSNLGSPYHHLGYLQNDILEIIWSKTIYGNSFMSPDKDTTCGSFLAFSKRYPNSYFLPLLNERLTDCSSLLKEDSSAHQINGDSRFIVKKVDSLQELISQFKGKPLLIDLWATWCIPCIKEFDNRTQLNKLLAENEMNILYISIDEASKENTWRKMIKSKNLAGWHLRASEALQGNILKLIYDGKDMSIPRYMLVNKEGLIINKDAPRPSNRSFVKEINAMTKGR